MQYASIGAIVAYEVVWAGTRVGRIVPSTIMSATVNRCETASGKGFDVYFRA